MRHGDSLGATSAASSRWCAGADASSGDASATSRAPRTGGDADEARGHPRRRRSRLSHRRRRRPPRCLRGRERIAPRARSADRAAPPRPPASRLPGRAPRRGWRSLDSAPSRRGRCRPCVAARCVWSDGHGTNFRRTEAQNRGARGSSGACNAATADAATPRGVAPRRHAPLERRAPRRVQRPNCARSVAALASAAETASRLP